MENITALINLGMLSLFTVMVVSLLVVIFMVAMYYLWRRR